MLTSADTEGAEVRVHEELAATAQLLDPPCEHGLPSHWGYTARFLSTPALVGKRNQHNVERDGHVDLDIARVLRRSNLAFTFAINRILLPLWCSTVDSTQISGLTGLKSDISLNSPSGEIKEIVRSFSKRDSCTH